MLPAATGGFQVPNVRPPPESRAPKPFPFRLPQPGASRGEPAAYPGSEEDGFRTKKSRSGYSVAGVMGQPSTLGRPASAQPPASEPLDAPVLHLDTHGSLESALRDYRPRIMIVKCGADWCAPCRHSKPLFDRFAIEQAGIDVLFCSLDVDKNPALSSYINAVPVYFFYLDQKLVTDRKGRPDVLAGAGLAVDREGRLQGELHERLEELRSKYNTRMMTPLEN